MDRIINFFTNLGMPHTFRPENLLEILILAFIIYELLIWVKDTRAWTLLRGIIVVVVFAAISYFLNLTTITWLFSRTAGVLITIIVIVFQPELRRALEQLGRNNLLAALFKPGSSGIGKESARSREKINAEIVRSVFDMSRTKTGALIIIEEQVSLNEYERTGIPLDALVSSQLLSNIFVKNTPLHDGAVFIRDERVVAATCYLPLSEDMEISKELGTRHRAGVGISELSDCLAIIVSEETGAVSLAEGGGLIRGIDREALAKRLKGADEKKHGLFNLKGIAKGDKETSVK